MRAPCLYSFVGGSAGAECLLTEVRSTYFRDWYLRSTWNGSVYVVDVYESLDNAVNQQSRLATGAHAPGFQQEMTFTVAPGAPWDPTPMKATFNAGGTWTTALYGWIAGVQAALLPRMTSILARYAAQHEMLEGLICADPGLALPQVLPAFGVDPDPSNPQAGDTNRFDGKIGMRLWAADEGLDETSVVSRVVGYAEVLRSIALDEQRTWGGFAQHTVSRGPIEPAMTTDRERDVFTASVPIEIQVADFVAERGPTDAGPGTGGKYVVGL